MRMSHAWCGLAVVLMTGWTAVGLAADRPTFDEARLKLIPQRMQKFVDDAQISGAVTLIASADHIEHVSVVGKADIAAGQDMQADTIFRIASMTKNVTAVALMQLVEQGKLRIDDKVSKYIPAFAQQKLKDGNKPAIEITVRQVLAHVAGLDRPKSEDTEGKSLAEIVDLIGSRPLEFQPGTKWEYSSGLTVAGRLIEVLSGESYADYLKKHIFDPLEMRDTTFVLTAEQAKRLARTYKPGAKAGTLDVVEIPDPTVARTPNPSGGLFSTAGDMAKFYQAVLSDRRGSTKPPKLLRVRMAFELAANCSPGLVTGFTPGNYWGLGWCVLQKPQGVTRLLTPGTFGHGGAWGTQGWIDVDRGLVLILMMNRSGFGNSDGSDVRDAFTELALQAHRGTPRRHAEFTEFHGHSKAVTLSRDDARVVIAPQAGGRVLEFSVNGTNAMWLEDKEKDWKPGQPPLSSAGRFDFGPELTVTKHPAIWSGDWTAEITGPFSARLISPQDPSAKVQLIRDFSLVTATKKEGGVLMPDPSKAVKLSCKQTVINLASEPREYCHWGRSFSPGGGICVIPLAGQSRFPSKYAMYEDSAIINVRNQDDRIRERDGFLEILSPPRKPKLGFDSYAGWLGYVMPNNHLFVKRYETYPDRPYLEAAGLTLSVWYPEGARIELEPIGPREALKPGEAASFTEDWWLLPFDYPKAGENIDLPKLKKFVEEKT